MMNAVAETVTTTEQQLDLDFRINIIAGNIKKGMKQFGFGSGDLWNIDPKVIQVIAGYNVRVRNAAYRARVEALRDNMMLVGFKKDSPLSVLVVPNGVNDKGEEQFAIMLKRGHQRLEAVLEAIALGKPIETVPCIIAKEDISEEDLTADLSISNNGEQLAPYEMAVLCKRMSRFEENHAKIATKLGIWPNQVTDGLLLINGPIEIAHYVRDDVIKFTLAVELIKEHGAKALTIIEQSLSRSQSAGQSSIKPRYVPGNLIKKAATKAAPQMKDAIVELKKDQAFTLLNPKTQETLNQLIALFEKAQEEEAKLNIDEPELNLNTSET